MQSHRRHAILVQDVTNISKRKNVGFPNSIEITWTSQGRAKHDFFTSFLHRREAYRMVVSAWAKCRSHSTCRHLHCAQPSLPCAVSLLRLWATLYLSPAVHSVSSTCQHKAKDHPQAAHVSLHSTVPVSSPDMPLQSAQPGHSGHVPFVAHVLLHCIWVTVQMNNSHRSLILLFGHSNDSSLCAALVHPHTSSCAVSVQQPQCSTRMNPMQICATRV